MQLRLGMLDSLRLTEHINLLPTLSSESFCFNDWRLAASASITFISVVVNIFVLIVRLIIQKVTRYERKLTFALAIFSNGAKYPPYPECSFWGGCVGDDPDLACYPVTNTCVIYSANKSAAVDKDVTNTCVIYSANKSAAVDKDGKPLILPCGGFGVCWGKKMVVAGVELTLGSTLEPTPTRITVPTCFHYTTLPPSEQFKRRD
uniref:Uncharacterized protein n=1 Tax=Ditylenchus dipsaci TaxID=166011 RepID=A0A915DC85_9BILA